MRRANDSLITAAYRVYRHYVAADHDYGATQGRARSGVDHESGDDAIRRRMVGGLRGEGTRRQGDLDAMRAALTGMSEAGSEPEYMRYDTAFHLAIASATRNRFMERAVEDTRLRLGDAMTLLPESDVWHHRIAGEHDAILGGIEARDRATAEAATRLHVANSEQGLRAVLEAVRRRRAR